MTTTGDPALIASRHQGVLVTLKRDGRPQLSNVLYTYDPTDRVARISVTDDRAKTRNLRRDPRASLHVASDDFWAYQVVEGSVTLSEVATDPHDVAADELADLYRSIAGEHDDWEEFRRVQVAEQRLVVRLPVEHVYPG